MDATNARNAALIEEAREDRSWRPPGLAAMAAAGWDVVGLSSDPEALFAVAILRRSPSPG